MRENIWMNKAKRTSFAILTIIIYMSRRRLININDIIIIKNHDDSDSYIQRMRLTFVSISSAFSAASCSIKLIIWLTCQSKTRWSPQWQSGHSMSHIFCSISNRSFGAFGQGRTACTKQSEMCTVFVQLQPFVWNVKGGFRPWFVELRGRRESGIGPSITCTWTLLASYGTQYGLSLTVSVVIYSSFSFPSTLPPVQPAYDDNNSSRSSLFVERQWTKHSTRTVKHGKFKVQEIKRQSNYYVSSYIIL